MVRVAMMPGIAQAKLDSNGNERPSRQPDAAHHAVEQKCGARQITQVLEHQDEEEQNDDLRQEHQHAADARQHAIHQPILEKARRDCYAFRSSSAISRA